jgi:hypothetical protein
MTRPSVMHTLSSWSFGAMTGDSLPARSTRRSSKSAASSRSWCRRTCPTTHSEQRCEECTFNGRHTRRQSSFAVHAVPFMTSSSTFARIRRHIEHGSALRDHIPGVERLRATSGGRLALERSVLRHRVADAAQGHQRERCCLAFAELVLLPVDNTRVTASHGSFLGRRKTKAHTNAPRLCNAARGEAGRRDACGINRKGH